MKLGFAYVTIKIMRDGSSMFKTYSALAPYLIAALMYLMRIFIEVSLCLWNLSPEAQKHVRFVIVP